MENTLLLLVAIVCLAVTCGGCVTQTGHFAILSSMDSPGYSKTSGQLFRCVGECVEAGEDSCWHGGVDSSGQCVQRPAYQTLPDGLVVAFASLTPYNYTAQTSGCMCFFNMTRTDCACCKLKGCQCGPPYNHRCVQCGFPFSCSTA